MSDAALFAGREIAIGAFTDQRSAVRETLPIGSAVDGVSPNDTPTASTNDETLDYRVRITPVPRVVDADDSPIDAEVLEKIRFPRAVIETPGGASQRHCRGCCRQDHARRCHDPRRTFVLGVTLQRAATRANYVPTAATQLYDRRFGEAPVNDVRWALI